ncbi:MAG TPA: helix-turn-helix transcriptional regulator [Vicinamibacterales bacterium]|nr:helix-turn-helix transcriptional regulator [Vicinamibacterales bacterium]HOG27762.1 helix-turn-helix transcriptional regulator [Vicinamibacterales bacterium]HOQ59354.1 helix-turn-helix transcriptional regulator [Vicinamibacterales bacterium]HPK71414.1 helix-turn-helix transcriptional regulator [Vicinamibacterales bacterium]HPW21043.1 helix-turn-helix transcriptional regulator [Vicinamibacterales bacterium]
MKIRSVAFNNHRRDFTVKAGGSTYRLPYSRLEPGLARDDTVVSAAVDPEIGSEGFSYRAASGHTGTVHMEQVLDYNRDPRYMRDALLYELTLAAQARLAQAGLSRRELARRMATSPSQLYRLLNQTNTRKSVDRMLVLLEALDCDVRLSVRRRPTPRAVSALPA